jgi:hypothetical protein
MCACLKLFACKPQNRRTAEPRAKNQEPLLPARLPIPKQRLNRTPLAIPPSPAPNVCTTPSGWRRPPLQGRGMTPSTRYLGGLSRWFEERPGDQERGRQNTFVPSYLRSFVFYCWLEPRQGDKETRKQKAFVSSCWLAGVLIQGVRRHQTHRATAPGRW